MTRTPKEAFIASTHRLEHETTTKKESFQVACEYSLMEFANKQNRLADSTAGLDSHSALVGARRVLEILKSLHEMEPESKPVKRPTLNYES